MTNKTITQHTLGPLKYCKNRYGGYDLLPADSYLIGSAVSIGGTNSEAWAAFIVRACNVHDELLSGLKIAVDVIFKLDQENQACTEITNKLLTIISKAEGRS